MKIDQIIRSNRKTLALQVNKNAELIVRIPKQTKEQQIHTFVNENNDWIIQKQAEAHRKMKESSSKKYIDNELFWYLGEQYPLKIVEIESENANGIDNSCNNGRNTRSEKLLFEDGFFLPNNLQKKGSNIFYEWYKNETYTIVKDRVEHFATLYQINYKKIKVTKASKQWGACTSRHNLNFSWRLSMLPMQIIDYVVVHELCHIEHPDHSKRFWGKVERLMPECKKRRKWLMDNGHKFYV